MAETGCDTRPHGDTPAFPMNEHLYYVPGTLPLPFLNITSTKGRALVGGGGANVVVSQLFGEGIARPADL